MEPSWSSVVLYMNVSGRSIVILWTGASLSRYVRGGDAYGDGAKEGKKFRSGDERLGGIIVINNNEFVNYK